MTYCIRTKGYIGMWCQGPLDNEHWRDGYVINGAWAFKLKGNTMRYKAPYCKETIQEVEILTHPKLDRFKWDDYNEALDWMRKRGQNHGKFIKWLYKLSYAHEEPMARIKHAWKAYKTYGTKDQYSSGRYDDIPF